MNPTIGRIVLYTIAASEADAMNRRREDLVEPWPAGAQQHAGNLLAEGDVVPMVITRVWDDTRVNGQAILDGADTLWVTSSALGTGPGTWAWPVIAPPAPPPAP